MHTLFIAVSQLVRFLLLLCSSGAESRWWYATGLRKASIPQEIDCYCWFFKQRNVMQSSSLKWLLSASCSAVHSVITCVIISLARPQLLGLWAQHAACWRIRVNVTVMIQQITKTIGVSRVMWVSVRCVVCVLIVHSCFMAGVECASVM